MYGKVVTVTVSIEETVSLGQGERGPDGDSYFPNWISIIVLLIKLFYSSVFTYSMCNVY